MILIKGTLKEHVSKYLLSVLYRKTNFLNIPRIKVSWPSDVTDPNYIILCGLCIVLMVYLLARIFKGSDKKKVYEPRVGRVLTNSSRRQLTSVTDHPSSFYSFFRGAASYVLAWRARRWSWLSLHITLYIHAHTHIYININTQDEKE